jgi:hypothetical protein
METMQAVMIIDQSCPDPALLLEACPAHNPIPTVIGSSLTFESIASGKK